MALRSLTLPLPAVTSSSSSSSRRSSLAQNQYNPLCYVTLRRTPPTVFHNHGLRMRRHVVRMAPEEKKLTRRSPLDFPIVSSLSLSNFVEHVMCWVCGCVNLLNMFSHQVFLETVMLGMGCF